MPSSINFRTQLKWHICEVFGIPVYLDVSSLILILMFATSFGSLTLGILSAFLLMVSIVAHECGHSLTARLFGCDTRDITISVIGGCASLTSMPRKAWQEFLVALAGPLVSFGIFFLLFCFFSVFGGILPNIIAVDALAVMMWMNLTLGAFNLLPGFPMDGGRIFRSVMRLFMSHVRATKTAMIVGRTVAVLLIIGPLFGLTHIGLIPLTGNFFLKAMIAWMIWQEGYREYQMALADDRWASRWDWSARVSPPPYGGRSKDVEVRKD